MGRGASRNAARMWAVRPQEQAAVRRGAAFAVVALAREELRRTRWARFGWVGIAIPVLLVLGGVVGDASDTRPNEAATLLANIVVWSTWACAGPIALGAAGAFEPSARSRGVGWLLVLRDVSRRAWLGASALAAMLEIAWRLAVPWVLLALCLGWHARSRAVAVMSLSLLALAAFTGVLLGGVATVCSALAGVRGRTLFAVVVVVPWLFAKAYFDSPLSVPGLLQRAWDLVAAHNTSIVGLA